MQTFEGDARGRLDLGLLLIGAHGGDLARLAFVGHGDEHVACGRDTREPEDLDRIGRPGGLGLAPGRVDERADAPRVRPDDDGVAFLQRAGLHEHGRHRPAAPVEPALDDDAFGGAIGIGFELQDLGLQRGHLEELLDSGALLGRGRHVDRLAAPVFGHQIVIGELTLHAVRIGLRLVDLVDRDDDRHIGGPRMVDGLHRLRHDAVVGGHDQDDDVRRLGTPSPHGRERFVTRRVEEGDLAVRRRDLIGPDVLRNAAELLLGDL